MTVFLSWYLSITLIGLAAFPLCFRLLPALQDRGYSVSRITGLLLWGFFFWLPGSLGMLQNDLGGVMFALLVLLGLSALSLRSGGWDSLKRWLASHRGQVLAVELVFGAAFAALAGVRAAYPEILYTEKPMEAAFINAILRSPSLPPHDPWLSGYSISYYYFGYLLVAMLARLTGAGGGVAFNLGLVSVFALAAAGVFGLLYNLLSRHAPVARARLYAVLGPFFVLVVSNLGGFLQVLHARRLFWTQLPSGAWTSSFWGWLDITELRDPPVGPASWLPHGYGSGAWWWWRSSRILVDYSFSDHAREIIDEFPFFSFLLGDLHPHVLAMPAAFLALGLALNLYLGGAHGLTGWRRSPVCWEIRPAYFALSAVVLGGLAFLNTWDFPIYVAFFAAAYTFFRIQKCGWEWERLFDFLSLALALGMAGVLLYLPFFFSFASQAGGFWPSLVYFTRGAHLWVMFAPLLLPLLAFLIYLWQAERRPGYARNGLKLTALVFAGLSLAALLFALPLVLLPLLGEQRPVAGQVYLGAIEAPGWLPAVLEGVRRRIAAPGGWVTLAGILVFSLAPLGARFFYQAPRADCNEPEVGPLEPPWQPHRPEFVQDEGSSTPFVLLIVITGALLVLAPEFFYLVDQFSSRMNTIFKFYFQAWLLWGTAAAYATAVLLQRLRRLPLAAFSIALYLVLAAGLVYPVLGLWDKTHGFKPPAGWTLDGIAYLQTWAPNEYAAIRYLHTAEPGVMVEAVRPDGGQYSDFARVSSYTGLPTVLGWVGHEMQWRGGTQEIGERQAHIERIYTARSWEETQVLLDQYGIHYIYIGSRERSTYPVYEAKFDQYLTAVFRQGEVTIYRVP